jgi:23S rRNA (uracil1939-C5)-methyltransferase
MMETLTIERVGAQGDGVASGEKGPVFVPFTLPGERVNCAVKGGEGTAMAVLSPSPDRIEAVCKHFEACGGCTSQHWSAAPYLEWKRALVREALASKGIEAKIQPMMASLPGERRRITFTARKFHDKIMIGFNAARSHDIIEIEECPVAIPALIESLSALKRLAAILVTKSDPARISVTQTDSGLDISVDGVPAPKGEARKRASEFTILNKWARLSVAAEIIVEPRKPVLSFGKVPVSLAPGGFLQAVRHVEEAMAALVCGHMAKSKRVADLFAGAGSFTFRLAEKSAVHAVESDSGSVAALDHAWKHVQGLKPISAEKRDLFRRPLMPFDLKAYDGVVFDPPRAGAEAQCAVLAKSSVRRVAAVSCNPVTLARDLRILLDGGYRLLSVTPFDQFLWSPHVEAVALLEK